MIVKWKFVLILVGVLIVFCCCGSRKKIQNQGVKDIYGHPIGFLFKDNRCVYYSTDGKRITACSGGVDFNGGRDSLSAYLGRKYINHPSYNYQEYNIYEYFIVLFDENLKIRDVRILYRKGYNNERFFYDSIFVNALKNTTGMWHKIIGGKQWYTYLHRQKIY